MLFKQTKMVEFVTYAVLRHLRNVIKNELVRVSEDIVVGLGGVRLA